MQECLAAKRAVFVSTDRKGPGAGKAGIELMRGTTGSDSGRTYAITRFSRLCTAITSSRAIGVDGGGERRRPARQPRITLRRQTTGRTRAGGFRACLEPAGSRPEAKVQEEWASCKETFLLVLPLDGR